LRVRRSSTLFHRGTGGFTTSRTVDDVDMIEDSDIESQADDSSILSRRVPLDDFDPLRNVTVNGALITLRMSDGDRSRIPVEGQRIQSSDGSINYFAPASPKTVQSWLRRVGNILMHELEWFGLPHDDRQQFSLSELPSGYVLFTRPRSKVHEKGKRFDHHLYGSRHVPNFRSVPEFALHAKWLACGMPLNESGSPRCGCTYCSGTPQEEISKNLKGWNQTYRRGSRSTAPRRHTSPNPIHVRDYSGSNGVGGAVWRGPVHRDIAASTEVGLTLSP